jgi:hypothetical protein
VGWIPAAAFSGYHRRLWMRTIVLSFSSDKQKHQVKRTAQGSVPVKIGLCLFIAIFSQSEVNMLSNPAKAK